LNIFEQLLSDATLSLSLHQGLKLLRGPNEDLRSGPHYSCP